MTKSSILDFIEDGGRVVGFLWHKPSGDELLLFRRDWTLRQAIDDLAELTERLSVQRANCSGDSEEYVTSTEALNIATEQLKAMRDEHTLRINLDAAAVAVGKSSQEIRDLLP